MAPKTADNSTRPSSDVDGARLLNSRIASALKGLRKRDKLTQEEVARGVGVSWRNYQRWEKGRVTPRPESVAELAAFYGVSEREIYGFQASDDDGQRVEELLDTVAVLVPRIESLTQRVADLERRSGGDQAG